CAGHPRTAARSSGAGRSRARGPGIAHASGSECETGARRARGRARGRLPPSARPLHAGSRRAAGHVCAPFRTVRGRQRSESGNQGSEKSEGKTQKDVERVIELYLIRHGLAEERGEAWPDDAKRPLTQEGMARLRKSARGLARLGVAFDTILTSPLVRTRQTADAVASAFEVRPHIVAAESLAP